MRERLTADEELEALSRIRDLAEGLRRRASTTRLVGLAMDIEDKAARGVEHVEARRR